MKSIILSVFFVFVMSTQAALAANDLLVKCAVSELRQNYSPTLSKPALVFVNGRIKVQLNEKETVVVESKEYEVQTSPDSFVDVWEMKLLSSVYKYYFIPNAGMLIDGRGKKYLLDCTKSARVSHYLLNEKANTIEILENLSLAQLRTTKACVVGNVADAAKYLETHSWKFTQSEDSKGGLSIKYQSVKATEAGIQFQVEYTQCLNWQPDSDTPAGGSCGEILRQDREVVTLRACQP